MSAAKQLKSRSLSGRSVTHWNSQDQVKPEDQRVWNAYIENLQKKPQESFRPKKGHDQTLRSSLDLHGLTIQQAFNATGQFLEEHNINGSRSVVIICGKSGKIADELPEWIANYSFVRKVEPILDTTGTAGAYTVHIYALRRR